MRQYNVRHYYFQASPIIFYFKRLVDPDEIYEEMLGEILFLHFVFINVEASG